MACFTVCHLYSQDVTGMAVDIPRNAPGKRLPLPFDFTSPKYRKEASDHRSKRLNMTRSRYDKITLKCCTCYCNWHCRCQKMEYRAPGLTVPTGKSWEGRAPLVDNYGNSTYGYGQSSICNHARIPDGYSGLMIFTVLCSHCIGSSHPTACCQQNISE